MLTDNCSVGVNHTELWLVALIHITRIVKKIWVQSTVVVSFREESRLIIAGIGFVEKHLKIVTTLEEIGSFATFLEGLSIKNFIYETVIVTVIHNCICIKNIIHTTISNCDSLNKKFRCYILLTTKVGKLMLSLAKRAASIGTYVPP